ncbi:MAG: aldo/keto reductase [Pseudomonadota bacterium]
MDHVTLGRTGIKVSKLCYGTMSFGGDADEEESVRLFRACRDAGINFFDCADVYNGGRAEEILGRLIAPDRDNLVITTKAAMVAGDDPNARGANRRHILRAVEGSLRRLNTDRVDILFMHRFDDTVPLEETLRALEALVAQGKVLYLGASNYAAWQIAKSLGISERQGWPRIDVIQPMYNLVKRQAEVEMFPLALAENIAVVNYNPVGGGLLAGKYGPGVRPPSGRLVDNPHYAVRYGEDWALDTAAAFTAFAAERGVHPVTLAVAWAAAHEAVTAPIIGARNVGQLEASLAAAEFNMTPDLRAEISALSRTPPPATDRIEEQV